MDLIEAIAKAPPKKPERPPAKGAKPNAKAAAAALRRPQPQGMEKPHLTVKELIALLAKCPPGAKVWFEGESYWGSLSGLRLFDMEREVLLMKSN